MDTSDTPWCWHYLADCGRWHRFEDEPDNPLRSEDIESHYKINSKAVLKVSSSSCDRHSDIDFSGICFGYVLIYLEIPMLTGLLCSHTAMLQTDLSTGKQRRIQRGFDCGRSCSCFSVAPVFWENVDPTCPYQLIPLKEVTPEYQCVAGYVKNDGLLRGSIVSISRIQNIDLWEIFCRKKKQLMRIHGVKELQERRLFHGTQIKNVDSICKYNFDVRLAGQNGHVYGKGVYFAKHASYANKYSRSSKDPLPLYGVETQIVQEATKIIFLARVVIGKSIVGHKNFLKPDNGSMENPHQSCVDDSNNPTIFVLFDPNQIYPEYLIQYSD
ncbi:poly [ADP-ribose] polymerase 11 isoform X1 [Larimichthys crocea]|uniref:poly [ADP-ribose] polymerase 11 isoform X1 n=1 Tax=Larimichthys crocea TaxID=215358 RepID=UPI000F5E3116|nr:poly [ADP-ribose] polymerase 11 isoform X1 [Larimichthys crocea]